MTNVLSLLEKLLILILCVAFISGCASLKGAPEPPRPKSKAQADPKYLIEPNDFREYEKETDISKKKELRNKIIDERLLEVDHQFEVFETELWREGVGSGIGTDWAQLAIAGLTATLEGESTKTVLGAIQTGIIGAKASFDKNTYMNKTLPAIMAQMVAQRDTVRAEIEKNKKLSVIDYTIYAAISDIRRFIRAGTIFGAIQEISKDAGEKSKKAIVDITSERTKDFVKAERQERIDKILDDIDNLKEPNDVIDLNNNPPVRDSNIDKLVSLRDPSGERYKKADKAREMLKFRAVMSERSYENLDKWEAALKAKKKK
jgi:hypothetical protein